MGDADIALPVISFLRNRGFDIISAQEERWGTLSDQQILSEAYSRQRFVLTHDADFGTLAVHRGQPYVGIIYFRPGGRPPQSVMRDLEYLVSADIDWTPPLIAVYRAGRLRLRRP